MSVLMMNKEEKTRGDYIVASVKALELNGDAYHTKRAVLDASSRDKKFTGIDAFENDMDFLVQRGSLHQEGSLIYLGETWSSEMAAAHDIAERMANASFKTRGDAMPHMKVNGKCLTPEQLNAISLTDTNRLSMVLGGAGTGKTTMIEALVQHLGGISQCMIGAPTNKAARNLTERSQLPASTIYKILNLTPENDLLSAEKLDGINTIIVDEASMLTIREFAGLLRAAESNSRIILLGDPNQLQSVGSGNIIPDLLKLDVPVARLSVCHRQQDTMSALMRNVRHFPDCPDSDSMAYDDSFSFNEVPTGRMLVERLAQEAAYRYRNGESVQVIAPMNSTVYELRLICFRFL